MEKYLSIEEHLKDGERSLIIHCESEKGLVLSNQNLIKLEMQIGSLNDISEYFESYNLDRIIHFLNKWLKNINHIKM